MLLVARLVMLLVLVQPAQPVIVVKHALVEYVVVEDTTDPLAGIQRNGMEF